MSRKDDRSRDHLSWLVRNRSTNEQTTLKLYDLLDHNMTQIESNIEYAAASQALAGIAFSLWRAVFLSDLTGETQDQIVDVKAFLGNLISNNSIGHAQDRAAREWTFSYYLGDARFRLQELASRPPHLVDLTDIDQQADSDKQDWEIAQRALEKAIDRFSDLTSEKA